jgi:DNA polymerase III alpha subunit
LYSNPEVDISAIKVIDPAEYNTSIATMFAQMPTLKQYTEVIGSLEEFDINQQANWHMPDEYKQLDIAEYILSLCKEDYELQRVAQELLLYQERDLFNLLRYLKYLVDTLRKNKVVWGVGRGSSVASYVLYLLGVHKINSMHYQLDITEFLK